ncbi:MAG TPA: hypothetical protein DCG75_16060 [Bacteroidales bacterium]|nr:hypothetical protein [Bacteroidales bacterium]
MKQIKIVQYSKPDFDSVYLKHQLYSVYIGERTLYFKNEVHVKRFIADSNRLLNDVLHALNYLYYSLFVEYRKVWFYLGNKALFDNSEEMITSLFNSIEKSFSWLVTRSGTSMNGNPNSFGFLKRILGQLLFVANHVKEGFATKDRFVDVRTVCIYINQINELILSLDNWGKGINEKFDFLKENEY